MLRYSEKKPEWEIIPWSRSQAGIIPWSRSQAVWKEKHKSGLQEVSERVFGSSVLEAVDPIIIMGPFQLPIFYDPALNRGVGHMIP